MSEVSPILRLINWVNNIHKLACKNHWKSKSRICIHCSQYRNSVSFLGFQLFFPSLALSPFANMNSNKFSIPEPYLLSQWLIPLEACRALMITIAGYGYQWWVWMQLSVRFGVYVIAPCESILWLQIRKRLQTPLPRKWLTRSRSLLCSVLTEFYAS